MKYNYSNSSISAKTVFLSTRLTMFAGVVLMLFASAASADVDSVRGKALYENHCSECHDSNVHRRDNRSVQSMNDLRTWVVAMSAHTGLDWQNEDIEDVAFYLNLRLYQFDE